MKITINRAAPSSGLTFGELMVDDQHNCWTLETFPVPAGAYRITVDYSPAHREGQMHLIALGFPHGTFLGSQIQLGTGKDATSVTGSDAAVAALLSQVKTALCGNFVWITVVDA